jgi:dolichol kinase
VLVAGALAATIVEALPIPLDDNLGITLAAGYTMKLLLG